MVCANEISHGKPHPEGYLTAAEGLAIAARNCIVIEDTPPGIEAAHNAHMRVIAVATTYTPDHLADADSIVERLTDLQIGVRGDAIQITT
jgi:sugar-phosphatase